MITLDIGILGFLSDLFGKSMAVTDEKSGYPDGMGLVGISEEGAVLR